MYVNTFVCIELFLVLESGIDNPDFQDDEETVNGDDITVSDVSTLGATGVDHSTLVREVETCKFIIIFYI